MKRLFTLVSALVMVASAVSAQEPSGMFEPVRPGFDFDRTLHAAPDAGLMCDSLKFRLNMDDSLWLRSYVKDYRLPESAAPQALGIDRLGTIVPAGSGMPVYGNPYASDYKVGGVVAAWNGGVLFGSGSLTSMPALMSMQSATLGAVQNAGNFTFTASVSADRAAVWRTAGAYPAAAGGMSTLTGGTYYTFAGSMTYRFSDNGTSVEMVTFNAQECDSLCAFIADNASKTIKVRFAGKSRSHTITLPERTKKAIAVCYRLYQAESKVKTAELNRLKYTKKLQLTRKQIKQTATNIQGERK